jgi:hypothetical protein
MKKSRIEGRGLYRLHNAWVGLVTQDAAKVRFSDGTERQVPEDEYRVQGYKPLFETLPWKQVTPLK